jgi:PBP1b-binding outer membrane lipoprotein LpoB
MKFLSKSSAVLLATTFLLSGCANSNGAPDQPSSAVEEDQQVGEAKVDFNLELRK